jgi:GNAT superfamily N-acetyltransferase
MLPIYERHYEEMAVRLRATGIPMPPFKLNVQPYLRSWANGNLLNYVVRLDGKPVGYASMYLTTNMRNMEYMGQEDALYVVPEHRNGVGRQMIKFVLADLKARGVKGVTMTSATDPRFVKLMTRMKFKETAIMMVHIFDEET